MIETPTLVRSTPDKLDAHVEAFEVACADRWPVDIGRFLPPAHHADRAAILCEIVRVDLEQGWTRGTPKPLADYRAEYPELFARRDLAEAVEFEERRLRDSGRVNSTAVVGEPDLNVGQFEDLVEALDRPSSESGAVTRSVTPSRISDLAKRVRAAHRETGEALERAATLPAIGEEFLGFRLSEELGKGSFGKVYLAHQTNLSDRPVALKITARPNREAQCLARLQHANIVPVLSVHRFGALQAICMPYYGRMTLGHVLGTLRRHKTLPASGHGLMSTLRGGADDTLPEAVPSSLPGAVPIPTAFPDHASPIRAMLAQLKYVDAVCWIVARLADGLAHAHERGVLHRDLKPDNVLLADDGQPMLLDFNLADEFGAGAAAAAIGGTLLYMSPEHLDAFANTGERPIDARSDLYAVGLIFYELLTGHHPYPLTAGGRGLLDTMRTARRLPPPPARTLNSAVTPAVEAVIRKLLAPEPADRYQSAQELAEDLDRHAKHLPLKYARETFVARTRKWLRRNPKAIPIAGLAAALLAALGIGIVASANIRAQSRTQAAAKKHEFREELRSASIVLNQGAGDPGAQDRAAIRLRTAVDGYGAADADDWQSRRHVSRLEAQARDDLRGDVGEALFLLARAKKGDDAEALRLNRRAESAFGPDTPRALWRQRAELSERAGDREAAADARRKTTGATARTARDCYLDGADLAAAGNWTEAIPALDEACRLDPQHYAAQFALGHSYDSLGRDAEALECYRTCIALRPEFPWPHHNRGVVYLRRGENEKAGLDFAEAIRIAPDWADARFARGTMNMRLKRDAEALVDFDKAEELDVPRPRLSLLRAEVRTRLNDPKGAAKDREAGLAMPCRDEHDHAARGNALLDAKPAEALAEFEAALKLNPKSLVALQNKAHVLAERLNRPADALAVLDSAVELYPAYVPARAGRAVYSARFGMRTAAHRDAAECLRRDSAPFTMYQLAGVYALTAKEKSHEAADRREAIRLLAAAFTAGFADFATVDIDSDLNPIRAHSEFTTLVAEFRDRAKVQK